MGERHHDEHAPGCPRCNAEGGAAETELCTCLESGYAEGLKRWHEACPCCFSDAYPQGLEAALAEATA
jgi:hypothetical protein